MHLSDSQPSKKVSLPLKVFLAVFLSFNLLLTPIALGAFVGEQSVLGRAAGFVSGAVAPEVQAQNNQKATPKPAAKKQQQPNFLQQLWNFITAPFRALFGGITAPKTSPKPKVTPQTTPAESPSPAPATQGVPSQVQTSQPTSAASAPVVVTSLPKGVTYIDLIGKTIIDSNGKIYPSNAGLALTDKPSLGTYTNKFYGLFVRDFEVSTGGDVIARGKVTLGDENTDKIDFTGRVVTDFVPRNNDEVTLGKSGNAWLSAFITTINSSTVNTGTFNASTLKLDDGTAASPGLQFTNDSNTGLWRIGADQVALTTAGSATSGITINASGNLGVGTTTPNSKLSVIGAGAFGSGFGSMTAPSNGLLVEGSVGIGISVPSQTFQIGTGSNALVFTSGGNLGIGTTSPNYDLEVLTTARIRGAVGNVGLVVAANGNVGIGTTAPSASLQNTGNTVLGYSGTVYGPASGLAVSGNVGVGVTTANNALQVLGAGLFSGTWGGAVVPTNGLVVEGNTGIGISVPSQLFQVGSAGNALAFTSGGNLGIGITTPGQALEVIGTARIRGSVGTTGLVVASNGNVGIGTTAPGAGLQLTTNGLIGYTGNVYGPASGLAVSGNVGIGVTTANSNLAIAGNLALGAGFAGMVAPTNGLLVEGSVGIGISAPSQTFQIGTGSNALVFTSGGNLGIGTTSPNYDLEVLTTARIRGAVGNVGLVVAANGNVGIGTTAPSASLQNTGNTVLGYSGTVYGPASGLAVSGNVGVGVTTANNALQVLGAGLFSGTWGGAVVPTNGLVVEGNTGIGISVPSQLFQVGSAGNALAFTSGGNLGVGITTPLNTLDVVGTTQLRGIGGVVGLAVTNDGRVGIGRTNPGSTLALAVQGNVGVGVTTANSTLAVAGNGVFGAGFAGMAATTNGLLIEGSVGIGISVPSQTFQIGTGSNALVFTSGGNLGIGTTSPNYDLEVLTTARIRGAVGNVGLVVAANGNVGIGTTAPSASLQNTGNTVLGYSGTVYGPASGLAVSGNVGVGVTTANNALQVLGAGLFSGTWGGAVVPTNGLVVEGNTGIGISVPSQLFQVGSAGNALAFTSGGNLGVGITTPLNTLDVVGTTQLRGIGGVVGLAVTNDGRVGIGRTNPGSAALSVNGNVGLGSTSPRAQLEVVGNGSLAAVFMSGNVGIGQTDTGFNNLQITGTVGIGTSYSPGTYSLDVAGKVRATGYFGRCGTGTDATQCNQDVAEIYDAAEDVAPGDLLSIQAENQRQVIKSQGAYDGKLMGIVSTSPGLLLGINGSDVAMGAEASGYPETADPRKPAVALSGKVPVKVLGAVSAGDYLTSSSIPGVAMKATKAGPVVGQALEDYAGEGVGKVLTFVRLGYFNGTRIADVVDASVLGDVSADFSQLVLAKLLSEREALQDAVNASELLTDRIAAGVEVITPQLTADNILAGVIKPLTGKNLAVQLAQTQAFEIKGDDGVPVITFKANGDATFKGDIVAKSVSANIITGLRVVTDEVVTSKLTALLDAYNSKDATASSAQVAGVTTSTQPAIDTNVLVKLNADGGITIGGSAEFKGQSLFASIVEFVSNVVLKGDVSFIGRVFLPKDSVGTAVVKAGADSVTVSFARGYDSAPTVNVTPTMYSGNDGAGNSLLTGDVRFVVQGLSGSGFTIKLSKAAPADLVFSWTALAQGGNQFTSTAPAVSEPVAPVATPAPTPSATPAPSVEPTPSPSPAPSSSPEASASATPAQ